MQTHPAVVLPAQPLACLDDYLALGGGGALRLARDLGPEAVIEQLRRSGLRGRGGAGFPAATKWAAIRSDACAAAHVVCNAAEGEPGTFKDRWLLRANPYQVLEGLAVAAFAVGATTGVVALKRRFHPEVGVVRRAVAEMAEAGLLGHLRVQVALGPDEYLFGEEKALLEVIEGNDPLPRIFPPYRLGLFARRGSPNPTLVHNVETLANVPVILRTGVEHFRSLGTEDDPGTRLITLSGDVRRPGVYELPLGTPLRAVLDRAGGGPSGDAALKAVFVGACAAPVARERFDTPLDVGSMRAIGSALGSGGLVAYDESSCIVKVALGFARFLWIESCAQCPACKHGGGEIVGALARIEDGAGSAADVETIRTRCGTVTGGSRCGLPAGMAQSMNGVLSTFADEVGRHLGRACPRPRPFVLPKMVGYDARTHRFLYDGRYDGKLPDWTFAPPRPQIAQERLSQGGPS